MFLPVSRRLERYCRPARGRMLVRMYVRTLVRYRLLSGPYLHNYSNWPPGLLHMHFLWPKGVHGHVIF